MSTTVSYKGATLTTVTNQTKHLLTAGKYMEDNITITDESSGGSAIVVTEELDEHGGTIKYITAVDLSNDTVSSAVLLEGYTAHDFQGNIVEGGYAGPALQEKTVNPTTSTQNVTPDNGYNGLSKVVVNAMPTGTAGTPTASKGTVSNHSVTVTPSVTNTTGYITGSTKTGTGVTVTASELASGNKSITSNGTGIDVVGYSTVSVSVSGGTPNLQTKSVTPTESAQTITADTGYDGLEEVDVGAISSTYVGSGITQRSSTDLSASGATVTVPAGYYASQASKSVSSGSATAPASISGTSATVSTGTNTLTLTKTVSVTPSVTAGYVSSGTAGNSFVSLTASVNTRSSSDLTASGATVTAPAGYYASSASKSVASGSATGPSSLSASSATVSTGTNTLTLTKTGVTTTPTVSAGYVSSATASTATVALTASVTTKAATTYNTSSSDQTIASGTYLTGTQTIKAVTVSGLAANKILSGTTVKIGDANDDDRIASVSGSVTFQTYYTGSSAPSSSQGVNGDIYLQTS